jgi:hypothetical protein
VIIPKVLTDGVPKGYFEGFWHFWHCLTLGISLRWMCESVKSILVETQSP